MSGGGRSAEDAQSGQRDHMQRKNHLPSRRCAAYPCVRVRRAEQSGAERSHQRTAFPLAPPPRRVRRSLMLEEHNRSHDDSASLSLPLSPPGAAHLSLPPSLFLSPPCVRACVPVRVCVCPSLSLSLSLYWQNKSIAMAERRYANGAQRIHRGKEAERSRAQTNPQRCRTTTWAPCTKKTLPPKNEPGVLGPVRMNAGTVLIGGWLVGHDPAGLRRPRNQF